MKKNWIRKALGGISLTSALFIFQACYGTPQDYAPDLIVEGQVKSSTSGLPVMGIKVSVVDNMQYQLTDEEGKFSFYTEMVNQLNLRFQDIDSTQNGFYKEKDTLLSNPGVNVYLDIALEEQ